MKVAFVNENTLGHASYLLPFVNELRSRSDLGVTPLLINATPLPERLRFRADFSIRGLRKWGLDFHNSRWRMAVSRYVRDQLVPLVDRGEIDAIVVNTQSVALALDELAFRAPVFVCLDATFHQLSGSRWFAPNAGSRFFLPLTAAGLRTRERKILERASGLFAWSEGVRDSLLGQYGSDPERVMLLPPSTNLHNRSRKQRKNERPRILFIGGDFKRKGGSVLVDCYRRWFSTTCDLHLVTQSSVEGGPGIYIHRNIAPYTEPWFELWHGADVFVFPSALETFGIVLLEALAFEVPVISADVGAARFVLAEGKAGCLLSHPPDETISSEILAEALSSVLRNRTETRERVTTGRRQVEELFDLSRNTERLAARLRKGPVSCRSSHPVREVATPGEPRF
jgi:glycosyltransferase involved in cell wall biosynthesis